MKFVAPVVITAFLSWVLYRETGTWAPVEVYPKNRYDADQRGGRAAGGQFVRDSPMQYTEQSIDRLEERRMGGRVSYPKGGVGATHDDPITFDS